MRTACGDDRQLPFVQIDKAERTLSGADVRVARISHPDSRESRGVVRFRSHEFHK